MAHVTRGMDATVLAAGAAAGMLVRRGSPNLKGRQWTIGIDTLPQGIRLTRPLHPSEGKGTVSVMSNRVDQAATTRLIKAAIRDMKRLEARADAMMAAGHDLATPPAWSLRAHPVVAAALRHGRHDIDPGTWKTRISGEETNPTRQRRYVATDDRHVTVMVEFRIVGDSFVETQVVAMLSLPNDKARRLYEFHSEDLRDAVTIHGLDIPQTLIPSLIGRPIDKIARLGCDTDVPVTDIDTEDGQTVLYTEAMTCWIAEPPPHVDLTWRD